MFCQLNNNISLIFPLLNLFLFLNLCPQQIMISAGFEVLSEEEQPIDDSHRLIDKRSSEEYEEFIKGGGRFPMGFGKRSSPLFSNNFERSLLLPSKTRLFRGRNNWVIRPFIYGINQIPREE